MRLPRPRVPSLPGALTFVVVAACSLFVFIELHPHLLLMNTYTSGGDMGAHTWAPWDLKHHLLPHGRISGWAPDWYDGFPALTFYFPFPAVMIVLLSYLIPYAVAFKLGTVTGVVTLPIAAWAYGRLARLPFPVPACLAAATLPFLFDTGFTIFGGNIASTLAGEYMFSIGLSLAMVFLGVVTGGLETNKRRAWAAILFALIVLSHVLIAIFALSGGILILLLRLISGGEVPEYVDYQKPPTRRYFMLAIPPLVLGVLLALFGGFAQLIFAGKSANDHGFLFLGALLFIIGCAFMAAHVLAGRDYHAPNFGSGWLASRRAALRWGISVGVVGGLLSGIWSVPFVLQSKYMNDMGWEKIGTGVDSGEKLYNTEIFHYGDALFPSQLLPIVIASIAGALLTCYFRRRVGIFWVLVCVASAVGFVLMPQGRLWNARLLPFYYFSLYILAGLFVAEIGWGLAAAVRKLPNANDYADGLQLAAPAVVLLMAFAIVVPKLPTPGWWPFNSDTPWHNPATNGVSFVPDWATWNYAGYNGKMSGGKYFKPAYPEYQSVIDMMARIGDTNGCGRVMWEYEPTLDRFGTPMALMLLPLHTNGCMQSEEGLFFESSATVPYHFLNQAELSQSPSSAMRDLPYGTLNVSDAVTKLQMLGVKYYLAVSPQAEQQADADPRLTRVGTTPAAASADGTARTWVAYEINSSNLVAPLDYLPAVMKNQSSIPARRNGKDPAQDPLSAREAWLENGLAYYQNPADFDIPYAASGPRNWPRVTNAQETPPRVAVDDPARVTQIETSDDRISFHVDNPGSPVVVRTSYFPDWQVQGGKGPYRITPNLMVVIPTSKYVTLHYGRSNVDWLGIICTFLGMIGIAWLVRGDRRVGELSEPDPATADTGGMTPYAQPWIAPEPVMQEDPPPSPPGEVGPESGDVQTPEPHSPE